MKSAREMFEELGYELDNKPRMGVLISYTKFCNDGCCVKGQLAFYDTGIDCDEAFMTREFIKAINKQVEELGWLDE